MYKQRLLIACVLLCLIIVALPVSAGLAATGGSGMAVSPAIQTVNTGVNFDISVTIKADVASRGGQCALTFNPALIQCNSVTEGSFFKNWAQAHSSSTIVYPQPTINNSSGQVSLIGIAIMGQQAGGPSGSGEFCTFHMTARSGSGGTSAVTLSDVAITDQEGNNLPGIAVNNGQIIVSSPTPTPTSTPTPTPTPSSTPTSTPTPTPTPTPSSTSTPRPSIAPAPECDVNRDGTVNIGDIVALGLRWGQKGAPGWVAEDVNKDGTISILDVVVIGLHLGEHFSSSSQTPAPTATPTPTPAPAHTSTPKPAPPPEMANLTATTPVSIPASNQVVIDLSGIIDSGGIIQKDFRQDNFRNVRQNWIASLEIKSGTMALTKDDTALQEITIQPSASPPPLPPAGEEIIGFPTIFGPDGTTFSQPISVTFEYTPAMLPTGVSDSNISLAFYDVYTGTWIPCSFTLDTTNHHITGYISHFTLYAILAKGVHGIGWALTGIMIFGELVVGAAIILFIMKRRRAPVTAEGRTPVPVSLSSGVDTARENIARAATETGRGGIKKSSSSLNKVRLEINSTRVVLDKDEKITQNIEIIRATSLLPTNENAARGVAFYFDSDDTKSESPLVITLEYDAASHPRGIIKIVIAEKSSSKQGE